MFFYLLCSSYSFHLSIYGLPAAYSLFLLDSVQRDLSRMVRGSRRILLKVILADRVEDSTYKE
jgi:hypothetical protein